MSFDLAQVNIARLAADLDSPQLKDFVDALDPINAEADRADGFRWRMQTEDGNATSVVAFSSDQQDGVGVITNMSTWRDVDSLAAFVFGPMHVAIMRRRREWFLPMRESYTACWWVPAGHRPPVSEAEDRVRILREQGPTPAAFTLKRHYAAPDDTQASAPTGQLGGLIRAERLRTEPEDSLVAIGIDGLRAVLAVSTGSAVGTAQDHR